MLQKYLKKVKKLNEPQLLGLILFLALIVRLYKIDNPVADWHAFRQADTASVTREYVKAKRIDLLRPQYQDLSNIQSGQDNPNGYRMVEFPLINAVLAQVIKTTGWDLVLVSRLASVLTSLGTLFVLFKLVKEISGQKVAFYAALTFALMPYAIFYSRVILPEPYLLFFSTLSLWQFYLYLEQKKPTQYLFSSLALALAFLLKPFVVFLAPVFLALLWQKRDQQLLKDWKLYLYPILALLPVLFWRKWILNFPAGIPVSDWLYNSNLIRFRPAWFRWLFYERLTKLFLGLTGVFFILANLLKWKKSPDLLIYGSWAAGILLYFSVIATGNVQHDYYQNLALPLICIAVGRGVFLLNDFLKKKLKNAKLSSFLLSLLLLSSWLIAWKNLHGYYNINHWEYLEAGQAINQLTPKDSLVIAPAMGDTHFLFQSNRRGWPIGFAIDEKIAAGATVYATTSYDDEARELEAKYQTIKKTERYLILDLSKTK